jgi:hypothetical protein
MADIVLAYCASHGPSTAVPTPSDRRCARFFDALGWIRSEARERGVQACVVLGTDLFTNFSLENIPQLCVGLGERNWAARPWRPIDISPIPGHPALARHIAYGTIAAGFDPAISHRLQLDATVQSVYHELDPWMRLPLVPIVQNCAFAPLMSVQRCYAFGRAVGEAIRSFDGLRRVALVGAGGLSHWIGTPRAGDIEEGFDRWFLEKLEDNDLRDVLSLSDSEIELAGNGAHEIRSWLVVAGAVAVPAQTLAYDTGCPGLTGMAVSHFETP